MENRHFQPLTGLRIVTLAINIPGPVAVARLVGLGATAVKIEPPTGDPLALASRAWYQQLHQQVKVISLNLKQEAGRAALNDHLAASDLLITSTRPAALARLNLDWPTLQAEQPHLSQVAITGYPPPDENKAGHDLTYQAALGLLPPLPEEPPAPLPRTLLADLIGAERVAGVALALLLARERDQAPAYVPVALSEAAASLSQPLHYGLTAPGGVLGGGWPGYKLYQTQEGWLAVAALEPHFWERLLRLLGVEEGTEEALAARLRARTAVAWEAWAAEHDLPLLAVHQ